ncbi:MAG TPA: SUKH-3 domain-containing protein [Flavobacteriales bacterium]|nr:SUKH-3 domain-containing protein [Flavobacteriales bacterium]
MDEIEQIVRTAGWYPGRDVLDSLQLPTDFEIFESAASALREFGGICVGSPVEGRERASNRVVFDPAMAEGLGREMRLLTTRRLYPIAEVNYAGAIVFMDERGLTSILADDLEEWSIPIWDMLSILVIGLAPPATFKVTPRPVGQERLRLLRESGKEEGK